MNKKGLIFIIAGLLFIMAALALFVYNTIQSENAGTSSQRIVASLKDRSQRSLNLLPSCRQIIPTGLCLR